MSVGPNESPCTEAGISRNRCNVIFFSRNITVIISRRIENKINAYKILVGKAEEQAPPGIDERKIVLK